ncbi:uncharacterized protein PGTG_12310 [Puccinia graminis f. sp. tritici CRL 75-36-700-3]|uniref:Uncharacterized protein n=1 Tax=Puccinia graminis f. sp. tritici (strain CRL 75-36-700-3 / race SCCL) TaxID=418459 RepID=E3KPW9_PUCGT|nr:uncharacterized protein PGTG_12310 [Puccinia graminis f. sp. tritici CRL 75-36-700-3]EFP86354.1 hypothetical protein PGTG_12310 [Puccinia graminis f. sp. tritici CRL 75-36-700-3]
MSKRELMRKQSTARKPVIITPRSFACRRGCNRHLDESACVTAAVGAVTAHETPNETPRCRSARERHAIRKLLNQAFQGHTTLYTHFWEEKIMIVVERPRDAVDAGTTLQASTCRPRDPRVTGSHRLALRKRLSPTSSLWRSLWSEERSKELQSTRLKS